MKKPYRYSVPGGEIVEAVGEWRTDVPESSYNQPVLELILQEPLEKEISVEDMQKIVDANEKLIKELRYGTNTISK